MTTPARQFHLDLGPASHIELLHANNERFGVCLANNPPNGNWWERTHLKSEAVLLADALSHEPDWYVGQQPLIPFKPRRIDNVVFLSSAYVDLDTYNTSYAGQTFDDVYGAIMQMYPDLPAPSLGGSSGRGLQLIWTFERGKTKDFLPAWAQIEDTLVTALKPFGADPAATDLARVLRLSGTVNSRSNTHAAIQQVGNPVQYEVLQRWCNSYRKCHTTPRKQRQYTPKNKVVSFTGKSAYTLHWARLQDYQTLGELRGGYSDHRRRATELYAASLAWYCRDNDSLLRELEGFQDRFIINPSRYHIDEILRRAERGRAGETKEWMGKQVDVRYRYLNQTIIDRLEITEDEQSKLKTILGKSEKQNRDTVAKRTKRRKAGVVERNEYLEAQASTAEKRLQEALELRSKGLTHKQIAVELGVTRGRVSQLLKREVNGLSACMS